MFEKIGGIDLLAATGGWWVTPPAYLLRPYPVKLGTSF